MADPSDYKYLRQYTSFAGGTSHPPSKGAVYRGTVEKVKANGRLVVRIKRLGNKTFALTEALRGPENDPYVVKDEVLCVYLDNEFQDLFILGRFNYKRAVPGNQSYESLIEDVEELTADLAALTARVTALEGTSHSH